MRIKQTTLPDAVARIRSGATIAIGGSLLRRQPMAIVHEMLRQKVDNLHLLTWATTMATDMLAGAGAVRKWEGIYAGFFRHGLAPNFRRAVEQGTIEVHDYSESALVARFRAAAMGLEFMPSRALLGTDIPKKNPNDIKSINCPFTGNKYHALRAARADFTILHGYVADHHGNVQWPVVRDSDDIDQLMASAAKCLIVTVEKIIPHEDICKRPTLTYIPHTLVDAVIEVPCGAHPTATDGFYDEDEVSIKEYLEAAKTPEGSRQYINDFILNTHNHEDYIKNFNTRDIMLAS